MTHFSFRTRVVVAGALLGPVAACGGPSEGGQRQQNTNAAGFAGFMFPGAGGSAGFVTNAGAPNAGYPPANTGGVYLTGAGGIPAGIGGSIPGPGGSSPGNGGFSPGSGGDPSAGGAPPANTGGAPAQTGGSGPVLPPEGGCGQALPAVTDYTADGPFAPATVVNNTGPNGQYTIFKPGNLGANGFKHPPTTWGNGITTMPNFYDGMLKTVATHGFVVIASNSTNVTAQLMTQGLDWLVQQDASGEYQGKLDTKCLLTIGYSLGGGAAITAGAHADVVATVSLHGLTGTPGGLHDPLLLLTSTTDTFVTASGFVQPAYNGSNVQTFMGTLSNAGDPTNKGHLIPLGFGDPDRAPMIAWMRLWAYGDAGAKALFYEDSCTLCTAPWTNPQRKNWQ